MRNLVTSDTLDRLFCVSLSVLCCQTLQKKLRKFASDEHSNNINNSCISHTYIQCIALSLSLSTYIYIYIYTHTHSYVLNAKTSIQHWIPLPHYTYMKHNQPARNCCQKLPSNRILLSS
ncbi:Hypothetical predicted protein [Octopus vulgaris]|uniref:Uncharacterized protein n=1 Tax=Octopus vulgaris TaxID=6645 RepID=A0AA36FDR0_OCTVU|nr:Hypothetical predicted protein [Octopus vulgaris]